MPFLILQAIVIILVIMILTGATSVFENALRAVSRFVVSGFAALFVGAGLYLLAPLPGLPGEYLGPWGGLGAFVVTYLALSWRDRETEPRANRAIAETERPGFDAEPIENLALASAWRTAQRHANRRRVQAARRACMRMLIAYAARTGIEPGDYQHVLHIRDEVPKIAADMEAASHISDLARRRRELRALEAELVQLGKEIDSVMDERTTSGLEERRGLRAYISRLRSNSTDPFA